MVVLTLSFVNLIGDLFQRMIRWCITFVIDHPYFFYLGIGSLKYENDGRVMKISEKKHMDDGIWYELI